MSQPESNLSHRRQKYVINPRFQLPLLISFWVYVGLGMLIAAFATMAYFVFVYEPTRSSSTESGWYGPFGLAVIVVLVLLAILIWASLLMTHRIAGPVFRALCSLDDLSKGRFSRPMRLRRNDAFKELANQVNRTAATLRSDRDRAVSIVKNLSNELEMASRAVREDSSGDGIDTQEGRKSLERAKEICSELTSLFQ